MLQLIVLAPVKFVNRANDTAYPGQRTVILKPMIISSDKANANVFCIRTSGKVRVYSSYRGGKLVGLAMYSLSAVE